MADLNNIAKIFALIDGILAIIAGVFGLIGSGLGVSIGTGLFSGVLGAILLILGALFMLNIYFGFMELPLEGLVLGIVVLVVGIILTTWFGIVAGILFIVDEYA